MGGRPPRLDPQYYRGSARCFFTICTARRSPAFREPVLANLAMSQSRHTASEQAVATIAYCLMPDHAHLLVQGVEESSSALDFVDIWKRRTGYELYAMRRPRLWHPSYYDPVLRSDEDALAVAAYILANPVRAGLASSLGEYPFAGSDVYTWSELAEATLDAASPAVRGTRTKLLI